MCQKKEKLILTNVNKMWPVTHWYDLYYKLWLTIIYFFLSQQIFLYSSVKQQINEIKKKLKQICKKKIKEKQKPVM